MYNVLLRLIYLIISKIHLQYSLNKWELYTPFLSKQLSSWVYLLEIEYSEMKMLYGLSFDNNPFKIYFSSDVLFNNHFFSF